MIPLDQLERWIHETNQHHHSQRRSCIEFSQLFKGFYSEAFLRNAYYVVVDELPFPTDINNIDNIGFLDAMKKHASAVVYDNTYYIKPNFKEELRVHFHELVLRFSA
ncbi:hypothetical protein N9R79_11615 [Vibrio sp.]|nr:hypothetical protein [Vibrio sp.]